MQTILPFLKVIKVIMIHQCFHWIDSQKNVYWPSLLSPRSESCIIVSKGIFGNRTRNFFYHQIESSPIPGWYNAVARIAHWQTSARWEDDNLVNEEMLWQSLNVEERVPHLICLKRTSLKGWPWLGWHWHQLLHKSRWLTFTFHFFFLSTQSQYKKSVSFSAVGTLHSMKETRSSEMNIATDIRSASKISPSISAFKKISLQEVGMMVAWWTTKFHRDIRSILYVAENPHWWANHSDSKTESDRGAGLGWPFLHQRWRQHQRGGFLHFHQWRQYQKLER